MMNFDINIDREKPINDPFTRAALFKFVEEIEHGSHEHRVWLRKAVLNFMQGKPINPVQH